MSHPYRESGRRIARRPRRFAEFDVSGAPGQNGAPGAPGHRGADGSRGGSGGEGGRGGDAGPASPGQDAGRVDLELATAEADGIVRIGGVLVNADGGQTTIENVRPFGATDWIDLAADGGPGGRGGDGGAGGAGGAGGKGRDASRWSSGGDGGHGGRGGDGGAATSGAPGGAGGALRVRVGERDTQLLMLVRHSVAGGVGGGPGENGRGGPGGPAGAGGDSYSWTDTESYTDSEGNHQTRTTYHHSPGGSSGSPGASGRTSGAVVERGAVGAEGSFAIDVVADTGEVTSYASRYELRLRALEHESANVDWVYEPGERIRVGGVAVENVGGMPTPLHRELRVELVRGGWVEPADDQFLLVPPGLEAAARAELPGQLEFRVRDFAPGGPDAPLAVTETLNIRAWLPSVHRGFDDFCGDDVASLGRFVVRYPVRLSAIECLPSLAAGERGRVRFRVTNQSAKPLGRRAGRALRVRLFAAPDSELGDEAIAMTDADGAEVSLADGWERDIEQLDPGASVDVELAMRVRDGAPEYRHLAAHVALELGRLDDPESPAPVQYRAMNVRVARRYRPDVAANLLLVVNHRTTRAELAAWTAVADELGAVLNVWDISREGHLDLDRPLADGGTLGGHLAGGLMVVLGNEIQPGADQRARAHDFLCPEQLLRVARLGLDVAFVGRGPDLRDVLVPTGASAADRADDTGDLLDAIELRRDRGDSEHDLYVLVPERHRFWFRWWAEPDPVVLASAARKLSVDLRSAHPDRRYIVAHDFDPEVESRVLWIKNWRVGALEVRRTLDAAAGALVVCEVDDQRLHDPAWIVSDDAAMVLLCALDREEKLDRLVAAWDASDPDLKVIGQLFDALLCDLACEQRAVLADGWRDGMSAQDMDRCLPLLWELSDPGLFAFIGTERADRLLEFCGRLRYLADAQASVWERLPPVRWLRRDPLLASRTRAAVDALIARVFPPAEQDSARDRIARVARALDQSFDVAKQAGLYDDRGRFAMDLALAPIDAAGVTTDAELLCDADNRVYLRGELDAMRARKATGRERRDALEQLAAAARDALALDTGE